MAESFNNQGNVIIDKIEIINFDGSQRLDFTSSFGVFEIKESLFSPALVGQITLFDTQEVLHRLPLIGEEKIRLKFRTDQNNVEPVDLTFHVYNISDVDANSTQHSKTYILEFTSEEFIKSGLRQLSKSYKGTPDTIAKAILTDLGTSKNSEFDSAIGVHSFISPTLHPLEAIIWMSKVAREDLYHTFFTFYETTKGFKFKSYNTLVGQEKARTYVKEVSNVSPTETQPFIMRDFSFIKQKDNVSSATRGVYSGTIHAIDPLSKTVRSKKYNLKESLAKFKNVDGLPALSISSGQSQYDSSEGKHHSVFSLTESSLNQYVRDKGQQDSLYGFAIEEIMLERNAKVHQLNNIVCQFHVSGDSELEAGMVVELMLPAESIDSLDDRRLTKQKLVGGRYIILSLVHRVETSGQYYTYIEASRDVMADTI